VPTRNAAARLCAAGLACVLLLTACRPTVDGGLPTAVVNQNRDAAGSRAGDTVRVRLVVEMARWFPAADDGPFLETAAFAESGGAPLIPGPMIRVPAGTPVAVALHNALADTLVVVGLGGPGRAADTLRLMPGAEDTIVSVPLTPGTYAYRAYALRAGQLDLAGVTEQLFGAFIVDSAGAPPDRVLVLKAWNGSDSTFVLTINGTSWPFTERLQVETGDTVRLRVINGGGSEHPMHLHGFYYLVDARGTWFADTAYAEPARRKVVTETLRAGETMSLTWVPDRPGNWLFHCHVAVHISAEQHEMLRSSSATAEGRTTGGHAELGMAGLVVGITVSGEEPVEVPGPLAAAWRVLVREHPAHYPDGTAAYAYAVQHGSSEPPLDEIHLPGEPLVLHRGELTAVTVVNRLPVPTAVHWHGIELQSYYDGVAGWSGRGTRLAPVIAPGDSFVALMAPPRAGTFIYHSHVDDQNQHAAGLIAPLLVLEPGAVLDTMRDHVWIFSQAGRSDSAPVVMNGGRPPAPLRAGDRHRIRIIAMAPSDEMDLELSGPNGGVIEWRALAKDGADLPVAQAISRPARLHTGPGETWDFEWIPEPGRYRLRVKTFNDFEVLIDARPP
jgi:FtsP/CotA-like multicopper oxidase with cupredoxin domain